ncbi:MAG: electron transfer flavoprotein subunit beta/FixA family protein [Lachnospiraceae bacterium]
MIMLNIIVCIKQVPAAAHVEVDPESGTLNRLGADTKTNPYDLFALETALQIRQKEGGSVTVLTMGPKQAESMMRDALMCGADEAVILSDRKFAGSDVLASSYTIAQGISVLGGADLIICGKQTTDGDTAQIGPAIAEHLNLPHAAWVRKIENIESDGITLLQDLGDVTQTSKLKFPCLITVDKDSVVPRLPSYLMKEKAKEKEIRYISFDDLPDQNLSRYGLIGSPTTVERMFAPEAKTGQTWIDGSADAKAKTLTDELSRQRYF